MAAALVFFRTAELRLLTPTAYFTYDVVLGAMIVLSALTGLYLLGLFRLHHDSPVESITAPRLLLSLLFLGLAVYLTPALFRVGPDGQKQRPAGVVYAWADSFLLPEPGKHADGLAWSGDLTKTLNEARSLAGRSADRQLVFIDFTGVTCKNCRINEQDVFIRDEIKDLFKKYRLVQLYTDTVPTEYYAKSATLNRREADAAANLWFQKKAFGTEQLPLYVILEPRPGDKIDVVGVYDEGKINNVAAFVEAIGVWQRSASYEVALLLALQFRLRFFLRALGQAAAPEEVVQRADGADQHEHHRGQDEQLAEQQVEERQRSQREQRHDPIDQRIRARRRWRWIMRSFHKMRPRRSNRSDGICYTNRAPQRLLGKRNPGRIE